MSYQQFSWYYDLFTKNVEYPKRAEYFDAAIKRYSPDSRLLLDLACGTGSLSVEFAKMGYDVIGVDSSADMLSIAADKAYEQEQNILFLNQKMQELNLYGSVDAAVCALDSLNHIIKKEILQKVFNRISLFLNPGGVFMFDVNTIYKHKTVLANNAFIFEAEAVFCAWQNEYCEKNNIVTINLDFFEKNKNIEYKRTSESFCERAYSHEDIVGLIESGGLQFTACFDEDSFTSVHEKTQRAIYICKKPKQN